MIDTYTLRRFARSTADKVLGAEAAKAADHIDAQTAEIARLRDGIEEAIRLLGMDRPIDPTDTLRAALSGESYG